MPREIYLDNSATTKPFDETIDYINQINRNIYGNPSSLHKKGLEAEKIIKTARESIASALKVAEKEIIFTSGGTESNNLAIRGYLEANPRNGKHIITTRIEHPSVLEVYIKLSHEGYDVDFIDIDGDGMINLDDLKNTIRQDTALISIIYVNNEIGTIQPIKEIVQIKSKIKKEIALHVDAVQGFGKIIIHPKSLNIDMLSVSSHKIHGPKGVGALYVNRDLRLKPIILGGGQEGLIRSGTENVSGICGFGMASEIIYKSIEINYEKINKLNKLFLDKLPDYVEKFTVLSPPKALPYILNVSFEGVRAEVLLHHLEEKNIYVSTGAACSSRKNIHSHVLTALGLQARIIDGAVRFSFSGFNTQDDIEDTLDALKEIIPKIKVKKK